MRNAVKHLVNLWHYGSVVEQLIEIACDESGYEGEKLIGATTDVFAHGAVRLPMEPAAECMRELRHRIRSPATEYKASHLLREKHRAVLRWVLDPAGPLHGNAHVFLIDKSFYVIGKVVDLLIGSPAGAAATHLYRQGRAEFGPRAWEAFLDAANTVLRGKDRQDTRTSVDALFHEIDSLRAGGVSGGLAGLIEDLAAGRSHARAFRERLLGEPPAVSAIDPLIPAIAHQVKFWTSDGGSVSIVHDRQTTLPPERVAVLREMSGGRLAGLSLVDSFHDPRVQLADVLAGTTRKIASDELNGHGDPAFTALLQPFVDAFSIWGDDRSWSRLS